VLLGATSGSRRPVSFSGRYVSGAEGRGTGKGGKFSRDRHGTVERRIGSLGRRCGVETRDPLSSAQSAQPGAADVMWQASKLGVSGQVLLPLDEKLYAR
jgi:hypothetical protein